MSTLNSSQMHVKRSSTRLHAPPGGHSSLSFGVGGFGTTDPDKGAANDPAEPPSTAGSFRGNTSGGSYGSYNHPANNQSTDGSYGANATAFHAMKGTSSSMNSYSGTPPSSQGFNPGYGQPQAQQGAPGGSYLGHGGDPRPGSTQSNYSWGERGSQPPLTSSKRDQNWEKKRRLWLARKNGGSQCPTPGTGMSFGSLGTPLPPPPMTAYGGGGSNYYEHDPGAYNPPSPLTKFMAQQTHSQPFTQPAPGGYEPSPSTYGGGAGRPPSSSGGMPPRTAMANTYRDDYPPSTAYSVGASSHGNRNLASTSGFAGNGGYGSYGAPPQGGGGAMYAPPRTSMPGTASSVSSTSSGRRQPPGGNSNWSPYS